MHMEVVWWQVYVRVFALANRLHTARNIEMCLTLWSFYNIMHESVNLESITNLTNWIKYTLYLDSVFPEIIVCWKQRKIGEQYA